MNKEIGIKIEIQVNAFTRITLIIVDVLYNEEGDTYLCYSQGRIAKVKRTLNAEYIIISSMDILPAYNNMRNDRRYVCELHNF